MRVNHLNDLRQWLNKTHNEYEKYDHTEDICLNVFQVKFSIKLCNAVTIQNSKPCVGVYSRAIATLSTDDEDENELNRKSIFGN